MSEQKTQAAKAKDILSKQGFRGIVELLIHPVIVPVYVIPAWVKSLWASRILIWGQWSRYQGFHAHNAINCLSYRTQWININRYGRLSKSPIVGLGDYSLSNWWYLSSLASYIYANAGAVTTLLGTLFWILSHLIWLQTADWSWVLLVTAIVFFSSTAYLMAFEGQNYQILGWMWLPIAFYGLLNDQLVIAALAFFAAALMGITALFVSIILVIAHALHADDFYLLLVLLPAVAVTTLNFIPILKTGGFKSSISMVGKLIGLIPYGVRYKRKSMKLGAFNIYFLLLYAVSISLIWLGTGKLPVLLAVVYCLFFLNQRVTRFADEESLIILFVGVAAAEVLGSTSEGLPLAGVLVAANPMPFLLDSVSFKDRVRLSEPRQYSPLSRPQEYAPFDTEPMLAAARKFLDVKAGSRILFAFDDPGDDYGKIFDGQRVALELLLAAASEKQIHLFPDWYAVSETNYIDSPRIWGRDPAIVESNIKHWGAQYVVIYQEADAALDAQWMRNFDLVSIFLWKDWVRELRGTSAGFRYSALPAWFLLKLRESVISTIDRP